MAMLTVQVWDATGNKRQDVEMPDDAPINRLLAVLIEKRKKATPRAHVMGAYLASHDKYASLYKKLAE